MVHRHNRRLLHDRLHLAADPRHLGEADVVDLLRIHLRGRVGGHHVGVPRVATREAADSEVTELGLGRDVGDRDLVADLGPTGVHVEVEQELVCGSETAGTLGRADDHRARVVYQQGRLDRSLPVDVENDQFIFGVSQIVVQSGKYRRRRYRGIDYRLESQHGRETIQGTGLKR